MFDLERWLSIFALPHHSSDWYLCYHYHTILGTKTILVYSAVTQIPTRDSHTKSRGVLVIPFTG